MDSTYPTDAMIEAYQRLVQLNLGSWEPEVTDWLHSEDAGPVLRELLAFVPCSSTVH